MDAASALLNPLLSNWCKSRRRQRPSFLPHYAVCSAPTAMALIGSPGRHAPHTLSMPEHCDVQYTHRRKWRNMQPSFHRRGQYPDLYCTATLCLQTVLLSILLTRDTRRKGAR